MSEAASQDAVEEIMQQIQDWWHDSLHDGETATAALEQRIRQLVTALDETAQWFHSIEHLFTGSSPKHYTDCAVMPCAKNRAALLRSEGKELEG
jgi:hypothetical protein